MGPEASSSTRSSVSTSPGSPGSASTISCLNLNFSYNIVNNTDSIIPGLTINNASESSGSGESYPGSPSSTLTSPKQLLSITHP